MAVKILTYIALIYQDLLKQKDHQEALIDGRLPPVFSMVFYTGAEPWNAPTELFDPCYSRKLVEISA